MQWSIYFVRRASYAHKSSHCYSFPSHNCNLMLMGVKTRQWSFQVQKIAGDIVIFCVLMVLEGVLTTLSWFILPLLHHSVSIRSQAVLSTAFISGFT